MTTLPPDPKSFQSMIDWLETELRQVKAQLQEYGDQAETNQSTIWDLADRQQRSEHGATNFTAQLNVLTGVPEELRLLRERIERLQGGVGQDAEQRELFGRQLRAEMQAERDERGELRRRTEFAEQAATDVGEKMGLLEDVVRRSQEEAALIQQRLEQSDINVQGADARLAANAEALRRAQGDVRNMTQERLLTEMNERQERLLEGMRRLQEDADRATALAEEFEAQRERFEALRQSQDSTIERANEVARDEEALQAKLTEMERAVERARNRGDEHERALTELRHGVDEAADTARREGERFLAFQEKVRRRQTSDIEEEIREIRGFGRSKAGPDG